MVFRQWGAGSPAYVGVDSELTLHMERASLAISRPTIASFWRCREEISTVLEALSRSSTDPDAAQADEAASSMSVGGGGGGPMSAGGGGSSPFSASGAAAPAAAAAIAKSPVSGEDEDDRVRFRLMLQLSKGADVAAFREDGRQLAGLEVSTLDVDLKVRPLTISLAASLGKAAQVDPIKPTLKAPGTERLNLT